MVIERKCVRVCSGGYYMYHIKKTIRNHHIKNKYEC